MRAHRRSHGRPHFLRDALVTGSLLARYGPFSICVNTTNAVGLESRRSARVSVASGCACSRSFFFLFLICTQGMHAMLLCRKKQTAKTGFHNTATLAPYHV